jgi:hypothetical protein
MKKFSFLVLMVVLCVAGTTFAASYSNIFEGETLGAMPADPCGDVSAPWWGTVGVVGAVRSGPTGGQVLSLEFDTTFTSQNFSTGEVGYTMAGTDDATKITVEYDFWVENTGIWQMMGDQSSGALVGGAMNDSNVERDWMYVGRDDGSGKPADITDLPDGAWVHFWGTYDKTSGVMNSVVSFVGGSGGFNQTLTGQTADIACEYWWGGWGFDFQMLTGNEGTSRQGTYDHAWYIDNFSMECSGVIPEPGTISMLVLGLLGFAAYRRKK